ncbi:hypothetical protein [Domibacillus robiginosus]|uniref:hypothetical protein n=1 Tax=Domibacillus robiginosus TaxID=1071054 RepID=UPI00067D6234|nr:hypothetical protein [Domibacillus robiginosus]
MSTILKKHLFLSGIAAILTIGLAGCGNGSGQDNSGNVGQEEKQENNHSDINEEMDQNNDTGTNEDDQIEIDPNDENSENNQDANE